MTLIIFLSADRFEVERSEKIGIGFFSDVYRGTWLTRSNRTVAIKVLRPTTPRSAYVHEVEIWKTLKHPNVLELYGASSASGEAPWFFVCRFCEGGNLVKWLKALGDEDWKAAVGFSANRANGRGVHLIRAMMEIAQGLKYLHGRDVVHGDLKVRAFSRVSNMSSDDLV
jgi:abelson tyrosine-protein kinase 1